MLNFYAITTKDILRFWGATLPENERGCMEWKGVKFKFGYGRFRTSVGHQRVQAWKAHRFSFFIANPNSDQALCVLHKCDNPGCVNPEHLFLGTRVENVRDMDAKKRRGPVLTGENHWTRKRPENVLRGTLVKRAVLTDHLVKEIRSKYESGGFSQTELGFEYGVTQRCIGLVVLRKTWNHVL